MKSISKSSNKGRPTENITPILKYTQIFQDKDGCKYVWDWDLNISKHAPLSVTIDDPQYAFSEKLLKELDAINKKYITKGNERKKRVTKEDKQRIEQIELDLTEYHYGRFPEDRTTTKILKNGKVKTIKVSRL